MDVDFGQAANWSPLLRPNNGVPNVEAERARLGMEPDTKTPVKHSICSQHSFSLFSSGPSAINALIVCTENAKFHNSANGRAIRSPDQITNRRSASLSRDRRLVSPSKAQSTRRTQSSAAVWRFNRRLSGSAWNNPKTFEAKIDSRSEGLTRVSSLSQRRQEKSERSYFF